MNDNNLIFRYSQKQLPQIPNCCHKGSNYRCNEVSEADAESFADSLYRSSSKIIQECFLLKYCVGYAPQRINRRNDGPEKSICIEYNLRKANGRVIKICKKAFFRILKVSEFRVKRICKIHLKTGLMPNERRGGDRKSNVFQNKKAAIVAFIKKFKVLEIHYCRSKIKHRQYLSSDLSINKISKMYNNQAEPELRVKRSYFRKIFNSKFNIGFKTPGTDKCSTCSMYDEQIKFAKNHAKKEEFMRKKRVHKLRSKAFYKLLKQTAPELLTMSFDCQKNQVLPKVPDQAAYFSRQLYQYNFGVVEGSSASKLTKSNVFLYHWTENVRPKGSNEIASAIFHRLNKTCLRKKTKIRLVADGCGGQNKNSIMVGMLAYWLQKKSPRNIKEIELIFPVVGHSFIPPDRVFAFIEKEVRNEETVIDPKEYQQIFNHYGTLIELGGKECPVYDWKTEAQTFLLLPAKLHFKFNQSKRFFLRKSGTNIEIRGEKSYKVDNVEYKIFNKKDKQISAMNPNLLKSRETDNKNKINDIRKLLKKHFGNNWMKMRKLSFYRNWMESITGESLVDWDSENDDEEMDENNMEENEYEDAGPICECCNENDDDLQV